MDYACGNTDFYKIGSHEVKRTFFQKKSLLYAAFVALVKYETVAHFDISNFFFLYKFTHFYLECYKLKKQL